MDIFRTINRIRTNLPVRSYAYSDKTTKIGLRQQYKQVQNRMGLCLGTAPFFAEEAIRHAAEGRYGMGAVVGTFAAFNIFMGKLFHMDYSAIRNSDAYKIIVARARKIYKKG